MLRSRWWKRYITVANSQGNDHGVGGREEVGGAERKWGEQRNRENRVFTGRDGRGEIGTE